MLHADFGHYLAQARHHMEQNDFSGALEVSEEIISKYPNRPFAWLQRARILLAMDAYRDALECVLRSVELSPQVPEASVHHARLLSRFHFHTELDAFHAGLNCAQKSHVPLLTAFAEIYTYRNRTDLAIQCIDAALSIEPSSVPLHFMRGRARVFQGNFLHAVSDFERCVEIDPSASGPYWYLSRIEGTTNRAEDVRKVISAGNLENKDLSLLWFALHQYEHREGFYAEAEDSLRKACRFQRERIHYSEGESRRIFDALKKSIVPTEAVPAREGGPTPIFIVGMHRSGTTLMEYLLSKNPRVFSCGELYDFPESLRVESNHDMSAPVDLVALSRAGKFDLQAIGNRYLSSAGYLCGNKEFFTDKLPSNYMNIGFIAESMPHAKIIHVSRAPTDTCFSNLRELFSDNTNPFSYDPGEMARYYLMYKDLMEHWLSLYRNRIHSVGYEELVSDPERVVADVSRYCGITDSNHGSSSEGLVRSISTASAFKVRGNLVRPDVPDWTHYSGFMAPAIELLDGLDRS